MIRGTLYATIGVAFGVTWEAWTQPIQWPFVALLAWPWVVLVAGPLLLLAAVLVTTLQRVMKVRVRGRAYYPLALLTGLPFGLLVCFLVLAFFGKEGTPWTDSGWIPWLPGAAGGGVGLGYGCVQGVSDQE